MQLIYYIALACAVAACGATPKRSAPMSTPNTELVRRLYTDYLNTGKTDRLDEVISPEFTNGGPKTGPAAFGAVIADLRAAFPDLVYTLDDIVADGDRVAVRWTWRGTHEHAFRNFAASGKRIANTGFAIFQITNGKIVRGWIETDRLGFLQAIGVLPEDPALGPPRAK